MTFSTALSGLNAASTDLDVIGNNIANANTIGFKGSQALFSDVYAMSSFGTGSGNAIGDGVQVAAIQQDFSNGPTQFTNSSLDLAIAGSGFFVLSNQGSPIYTRAGSFSLDSSNYLENPAGLRLMGYQADNNGNITTTIGELQINKSNITAVATANVSGTFNLNQGSTPPTAAFPGGVSPPPETYNYSTASTIYDSFGNQHTLTVFFIQADVGAPSGSPDASSPANVANQWYVAYQVDNQDVPPITNVNNSDNLYHINFNADGTFNDVEDTGDNPLIGNLIPLSITLPNGSAPLNFNVDLSSSTQYAAASGTDSFLADGNGTGSLNGLSIDQNGVISGVYSNGQKRSMGQLMLADFANPDGLEPIGGSNWASTTASGQPLNGKAGSGTLGLLQSGALEGSNVDLTAELINLITAQRNFQANAQTIRTTDAITQTIINIR